MCGLEKTAAGQLVELLRAGKDKTELEGRIQLQEGFPRDLRMDLKRISKEGKAAESSLQETRVESEKTSSELLGAKEAEGRMKVLFTALDERATESRAKVNALQGEMEACRKDAETSLDARRRRTHALRDLLGRTVEDLETSRAAHKTTRDTLRTAERDLLAARENEDTLRSQIMTLAAKELQLASFRKQQKAHDLQEAKYVAEINRLTTNVVERDARLRDVEWEVWSLNADVERVEESSKEERRKRDEAHERIRDFEEELDTGDETVDESCGEVSALEAATA